MRPYIHSHTTDAWPAVPLGLVLVIGTASLQDGLVNTASTSNHTLEEQRRRHLNNTDRSAAALWPHW